MNFLYCLSAISMAAGIYLQEFSHFIMNSYLESWYLSKITKLLITLGLFLEFISLAKLPMSTYVLLSSLHILIFKHILIRDEKRSYSSSETIGTIAILSGCLVSFLFGPIQLKVEEEDFKDLFDLYYYSYTFFSMALTFVLRRLGFFAGKIIVETGIVSQISSFTVAAMKIMWVEILVFGIGGKGYSGLCVLVGIFGNLTSCSFIRMLEMNYDVVVVMGGYYVWMVFYGLPLSFFVNSGVEVSIVNMAALVFGTCLVVPGVYLHSFIKIEYLKAYKESKLNKIPDFIV